MHAVRLVRPHTCSHLLRGPHIGGEAPFGQKQELIKQDEDRVARLMDDGGDEHAHGSHTAGGGDMSMPMAVTLRGGGRGDKFRV